MTAPFSAIDQSKIGQAEQICRLAGQSGIVRRVIVFGSAATGDCRPESDLDLCFDVKCTTQDLRIFRLRSEVNRICHYNCDIVFYSHVGNRLKDQIDRTGVTIYETKESKG